MLQLRDNQISPTEIGIAYFRRGSIKPSLMVEPVAFGKSIVIAHIVHGIKDLGKTLVLQPSKELLKQNYAKFTDLGGEASIYSASLKQKEFGDVTYATIGSIKAIGKEFKDLGYKFLIIDEADRYPRGSDSMLGKFLMTSGMKSVLGLTATPFKLQTNSVNMEAYSLIKMLTSRSKHGNFFKEIIHVTQIQEMVKEGFWAKLEYEVHAFDTSKLIFNSTKAEYTERSIIDVYNGQNIHDKIIKRINSFNSRKSIIAFVPSVAEAISLAQEVPNSVAVYGDMPDSERDEAIEGFKSGKYKVAFNVNVLSVGFDHPKVDCIILARATASLSVYYQQCGRGTRIHPDKEECLIVDFVGNIPRFGEISELYFKKDGSMWKLYGKGGKLLTGVPIDSIGQVTEDSEKKALLLQQKLKDGFRLLTFGKFKGKEVKDTPGWWREWIMKNTTDEQTQWVRDEIKRLSRITI